MAANDTTVFLGEFETKTLLELETRPPGTYYVQMMVRCNSLLSSVFLKACAGGATVKVNYYDTTTGDSNTPERYDLTGHDLLAPADIGETKRILVTKIHNKPILEVVVTGGSAEFGVYVTAVTTSASDLDSALIRDGDEFSQPINKAIPIACLNEDDGQLMFVRCPFPVKIVGDFSDGTPYFKRGYILANPGNTVTVLTDTVPALTTRKLRKLWVTATNDGYFSLEADGLEIAYGRLDNVAHNVSFNFDPPHPISAGVMLELKYISDSEPTMSCGITAFLTGSDFT